MRTLTRSHRQQTDEQTHTYTAYKIHEAQGSGVSHIPTHANKNKKQWVTYETYTNSKKELLKQNTFDLFAKPIVEKRKLCNNRKIQRERETERRKREKKNT